MKSRLAEVLNLCFSIFKRIFSGSALFQRAGRQIFGKNKEKSFTKLWTLDCWFSRTNDQRLFCAQKGRYRLEGDMNEELTPQKERFLREVEQQLLRKELDARLLENGLLHVSWNEKPLCSVDRDGIVRFRPADITGPEVDRQLRTVIAKWRHPIDTMRCRHL